ncbi:hypothetical protein [Rhizobium sp. BK176]|uniref:hypothetical protein n=1 Tax=Rhizobium sp. BK176 TaxID=2587071 RepID=UPI00216A0A69|nr:hypothetical protein [Rhizobium sp. BK176]MCS4088510.1 hypothetical protein [Rhizobium sp. BK176]
MDVSEAGYDRAGRINRASRVATSLVVVDGIVCRKVPEPKLKLHVFGKFAKLGVYFGGIHWNENGRNNFPGEYILPLTATDTVRRLVELHGIEMLDEEAVERVDHPELFTFRASDSLTEVLARRIVGELKEYVGTLDREQVTSWVELREMSEPLGKLDNSFGHDVRGDFRHEHMLDIVEQLSTSVRDNISRRDIGIVAGWARQFEKEMTAGAGPQPKPMGGPGR